MKNKDTYQDKFNQMKAPIDKSRLWESIKTDEQFPTTRGGNTFGYYLWIPLAFCLGGLAFYCFQNFNQINDSDSLVINKQISTTEETTKTSTYDIASSYTEKQDNDTTNKTKRETDIDLKDQIVNNTKMPSNEKAQAEHKNTKNHQSTNSTTASHLNANAEQLTRNTNNQTSNTSKNFETNPTDTKVTTQTIQAQASSSSNLTNINQSINSNSSSSKSEPAKIDESSKGSSNVSSKSTMIGLLQNLPFTVSNIIFKERAQHSFPPVQIDINPSFKSHWEIALQFGTGQSTHSIEDLSQDNDRTQQRLNHIRNLPSNIVSVSIGKFIKRDFKISLESEYEMAFQKFSFQNPITEAFRLSDPSMGFYANETRNRNYELYHKYKFMNLNLIGEKQFNGEKLSWSLGAGVNYNISSKSTGIFADANNQVFDISSLGAYTSRTNISFIGLLGARYQLTNQWNLIAQLRYNSNRNLIANSVDAKHGMSSLSFRTGVAFKF